MTRLPRSTLALRRVDASIGTTPIRSAPSMNAYPAVTETGNASRRCRRTRRLPVGAGATGLRWTFETARSRRRSSFSARAFCEGTATLILASGACRLPALPTSRESARGIFVIPVSSFFGFFDDAGKARAAAGRDDRSEQRFAKVRDVQDALRARHRNVGKMQFLAVDAELGGARCVGDGKRTEIAGDGDARALPALEAVCGRHDHIGILRRDDLIAQRLEQIADAIPEAFDQRTAIRNSDEVFAFGVPFERFEQANLARRGGLPPLAQSVHVGGERRQLGKARRLQAADDRNFPSAGVLAQRRIEHLLPGTGQNDGRLGTLLVTGDDPVGTARQTRIGGWEPAASRIDSASAAMCGPKRKLVVSE